MRAGDCCECGGCQWAEDGEVYVEWTAGGSGSDRYIERSPTIAMYERLAGRQYVQRGQQVRVWVGGVLG